MNNTSATYAITRRAYFHAGRAISGITYATKAEASEAFRKGGYSVLRGERVVKL